MKYTRISKVDYIPGKQKIRYDIFTNDNEDFQFAQCGCITHIRKVGGQM